MKIEFISESNQAISKQPKLVRTMLDWLQSRPDGKLYSIRHMASELGYSLGHVQFSGHDPSLREYRVLIGNRHLYWGNKKTIAEAMKQCKAN